MHTARNAAKASEYSECLTGRSGRGGEKSESLLAGVVEAWWPAQTVVKALVRMPSGARYGYRKDAPDAWTICPCRCPCSSNGSDVCVSCKCRLCYATTSASGPLQRTLPGTNCLHHRRRRVPCCRHRRQRARYCCTANIVHVPSRPRQASGTAVRLDKRHLHRFFPSPASLPGAMHVNSPSATLNPQQHSHAHEPIAVALAPAPPACCCVRRPAWLLARAWQCCSLEALATWRMLTRRRAPVPVSKASPQPSVGGHAASRGVRASNGMGSVQWCSRPDCRRINATALVAWAAGICVGRLWLDCSLPPIIMRRMPGTRTKRATPQPFWADSGWGHGTSASQSG